MYVKYEAKFGKENVNGKIFADDNIIAKSSLSAVVNEFIFKQYNKIPDFVSTLEIK